MRYLPGLPVAGDRHSLAALPYLRKAVKRQKAVVEAYPRSRAAMAFKTLAQKADKWPIPTGAAGHLEFFVERLIQSSAHMLEVQP